MTAAETTGPNRRALRRAALLAVGVAVGAALALVGGPAAAPRDGTSPTPVTVATHRGTGRGAPVLDAAALTGWCREVLDPRATAEFIGNTWWCAGRPGGIWRIEELDAGAACAQVGWAGHDMLPSEAALDCAFGAGER